MSSNLWPSVQITRSASVKIANANNSVVVVKNIRPRHLTNVNGTLFFTAVYDEGQSLWKSDGTETGTTIV
jgi:hypothetical protein